MAQTTNIQWCDATWNIARGCTKVDEDCKYCYMYRLSMDGKRHDPYQVVRTKGVFRLPLTIKQPSKIFTSSLTDVFHPDVDSFRHEMWDIIRRCPQHIFQILTKRPERIAAHLPEYWDEIKDRCWLGTSVGSQKGIQRIIDLAKVKNCGIKFLSLEPLHGEIDLSAVTTYDEGSGADTPVLSGFDWVIIGGESGNEKGKYRYRPCEVVWYEKIIADCRVNSVAVFVKQMGTHLAKQMNMSDRHGGNIDEFPLALQVREYPKEVR